MFPSWLLRRACWSLSLPDTTSGSVMGLAEYLPLARPLGERPMSLPTAPTFDSASSFKQSTG